MSSNSFGKIFRITTFGESHGRAIGVIIDGCPAGLKINEEFIQKEMARRKPGQSQLTTQRTEEDYAEIISGVFEGTSTGAPIAILIKNKDQRSQDYNELKKVYRPSHADYTYEQKYGIRDHRGGGRSSARETAARVAAGAVARLFLINEKKINIQAFVSQVGSIKLNKNYIELDLNKTDHHPTRCPDPEKAREMQQLIEKTRDDGDSLGGIISCVIKNVPSGLGEPVFDKLHAELGKAMLGINAVKGFEIGSGFAAAAMKGSEHNDAFIKLENKIKTKTNFSGGVQGGISNGEDIFFRVAFKPVATIAKSQQTVNLQGEETIIEAKGRHDPCVVPRAVPIVEAMAAIVLADMLLRSRNNKI